MDATHATPDTQTQIRTHICTNSLTHTHTHITHSADYMTAAMCLWHLPANTTRKLATCKAFMWSERLHVLAVVSCSAGTKKLHHLSQRCPLRHLISLGDTRFNSRDLADKCRSNCLGECICHQDCAQHVFICMEMGELCTFTNF